MSRWVLYGLTCMTIAALVYLGDVGYYPTAAALAILMARDTYRHRAKPAEGGHP